jgi:hypothetical protein
MASLRSTTIAAAGDEVVTQVVSEVVSEVDTVVGAEAVLAAITVVVDVAAVESSGVGVAVSAAPPEEENRHKFD